MENTAKRLEIMPEYKNRARILAITSGKGGVGKTNIAANLAICLAELRKKVLLFDADMSLGNLDIIMNINSRYNISHIIKGQKTIEEITQAGPANTEIICGASGLENIANINEFQRQRLLSELSKLQLKNDAIIIDTAAGISKPVIGFCLAADHTLVVTTPEATAITDAYAMIKVLTKNNYQGRISLIVNMAESTSQGQKTYRQIATVAKRFLNANIYNVGVILRDEQLVSAIRQRQPVVMAYPRARISLFLATLATRLSESSYTQPSEGFLRKVVDWFF
ncbi:MAG: MinD/ParA family protein [Planctomycetota bacterium]